MALIFQPMVSGRNYNLSRIVRTTEFEDYDVSFAAGGDYSGVVIATQNSQPEPIDFHVTFNFSLWLRHCKTQELQQEIRTLKFHFHDDLPSEYHQQRAMHFIQKLMTDMPADYGSFFRQLIRLIKFDFLYIEALEIETKMAETHEAIAMPDANKLGMENEIEDVTMGHVQELLERAFPNGLTLDMISDVLRADDPEVIEAFLVDLENSGIAKRVDDEWVRVETVIVRNPKDSAKEVRPTIAIITCLFVEKLAVDGIIEDARSVHKYKSGGDSNIYTIGRIGKHAVVATKLAMIGDSREATISAGSITTRLLGNFQYVDHVFILGTGGGVPHFTSVDSHVRRGDVVISYSEENKTYCYAHSFKKNRLDTDGVISGVNVRYWNPKTNSLAQTISQFTNDDIDQWQTGYSKLIENLNNVHSDTSFARPEEDILALPISGGSVVVVNHPDSRTESILHLAPVGSICSIKLPQKADEHNGENNHFDDSVGQINDVEKELHHNILKVRQEFIEHDNLRALDAGFDSVIAAVEGSRIDSWATVLGVCDYFQGNSRGAQEWKPHAAAKAASLLREAILRL